MKFLKLDLLAFGPFTNKSIDLSDGNFQIIYGPNEAGKSSALRAISDFLYGIPTRSSDNFIHPHKEMRIGAELEKKDGRRAGFIRTKKRNDSLRDSSDQILPDSAITPFLGNVSRQLFELMFGLSHTQLIKGGNEILAGKGDVGQSIFAAGMGIANLREILEKLKEEADELFLPHGNARKTINNSLDSLQKTEAEMRDLLLSPRAFQDASRELAEARNLQNSCREKLTTIANRLHRLQQIQKATPIAGRLKTLRSERAEIGEITLLPDDFIERRKACWRNRETAKSQRDSLLSEIEHLRQTIKNSPVEKQLLNLKTEISNLFQDKGVFLSNQKDLPKLEHERDSCLQKAEKLLRHLNLPDDLDEAEKLRISTPRRAEISAATDQLKALMQDRASTEREIQKLTAEIEQHKARLKEIPPARPTEILQRTVRAAAGGANLIKNRDSLAKETENLETKSSNHLKRLPLQPNVTLHELSTFPLPGIETLRRFETEERNLADRIARIESRIDEINSEKETLSLKIDAIRKGEQIPDEEELKNLRNRRDRGWNLVRLSWQGPAPKADEITEFSREKPLADAYEESVQAADEIADKLRKESGRVAELQQLNSQKIQLDKKQEELEAELKSIDTEKQEWSAKWKAVWQPSAISPLPPPEMLAWHREITDLIDCSEELREKRAAIAEISNQIDDLHDRLLKACEESRIPAPAEDLSFLELFAHTEQMFERIQKENAERKQAEHDLENLENRLRQQNRNLSTLNKETETARKNWEEKVKVLGLSKSSSPDSAQTMLTEINTVFQNLDEAHSLENRINGITKQCDLFEEHLETLLRKIDEKPAGESPTETVTKLYQRLLKSEKNLERSEDLQREIADKNQILAAVETELQNIARQIENLLKEAKTEDEERLPEIEDASTKARQIDREIADQIGRLNTFLTRENLDDFLQKIEETDHAELPGKIRQLEEEQKEFEFELNRRSEEVGRLKAELDRHDGTSKAAGKAQKIEEKKAALREQIAKFSRLRLASILLNREIERYRDKHQGPILRRTSEILSRLTLGAISEITSDLRQDKPQFTAHRPDGTRLLVAYPQSSKNERPQSALSDGTLDQLYLALRLASLEHHIEQNEPMPLILDDILINFDDARSRATLEVLAKISEKNQIIYFTHHRHILELAEDLPAKIHQLDSAPQPVPALA